MKIFEDCPLERGPNDGSVKKLQAGTSSATVIHTPLGEGGCPHVAQDSCLLLLHAPPQPGTPRPCRHRLPFLAAALNTRVSGPPRGQCRTSTAATEDMQPGGPGNPLSCGGRGLFLHPNAPLSAAPTLGSQGAGGTTVGVSRRDSGLAKQCGWGRPQSPSRSQP